MGDLDQLRNYDNVQEVGSLLFQTLIGKYAPEVREVVSTLQPCQRSNTRQLTEQVHNLMDAAAEFDSDPKRRLIYKSVNNLAKELKVVEPTLGAVDRLLQKYFPNLTVEDVIKVLVILTKAISVAFTGCRALTQSYIRSAASFKEQIVYALVCYVQRVICQIVRENGGWSVVLQKCKEFARDNWPLITAISSVCLIAGGIGIAVLKSKSNNK